MLLPASSSPHPTNLALQLISPEARVNSVCLSVGQRRRQKANSLYNKREGEQLYCHLSCLATTQAKEGLAGKQFREIAAAAFFRLFAREDIPRSSSSLSFPPVHLFSLFFFFAASSLGGTGRRGGDEIRKLGPEREEERKRSLGRHSGKVFAKVYLNRGVYTR